MRKPTDSAHTMHSSLGLRLMIASVDFLRVTKSSDFSWYSMLVDFRLGNLGVSFATLDSGETVIPTHVATRHFLDFRMMHRRVHQFRAGWPLESCFPSCEKYHQYIPKTLHITVQCLYNAVNFVQNACKRRPIALPLIRSRYGVRFCCFKCSVIFCPSHRSDVRDTVLYWTVL